MLGTVMQQGLVQIILNEKQTVIVQLHSSHVILDDLRVLSNCQYPISALGGDGEKGDCGFDL